jgi:hypothetical protein
MAKMAAEYGLPLVCAVTFVVGSLWLIKYLLAEQKALGRRVGELEREYRDDIKGLLESTTQAIDRSNECHAEVLVELRSCRKRNQVA